MLSLAKVVITALTAGVVYADDTTYGLNAICTNDQLMRWFDIDHGLWKNNDGDYYWWNSANMLTAFADLAKVNNDVFTMHGDVFERVHNNAPQNYPFLKLAKANISTPDHRAPDLRVKRDNGFLNDFYDDEGWWGLAWLAALDVTGEGQYLDEAIMIWYDMKDGWNTHHCGGLPWNKHGAAPVSIANELFIQLGAGISNRVGSDQKDIYLDVAKDAWNWFSNSGLIGSDSLIMDGVDDVSCEPNGPNFTYNQGVILGGLVELWRATGDAAWLDKSEQIAMAVTNPGSNLQTEDGILADECDKNRSCTGTDDGTQFKGIFTRNLKELYAVRPVDQYKTFLERNARSIWQNDLVIDDDKCLNGVLWGGPYVEASASSQSSALDCLNAAQSVVD